MSSTSLNFRPIYKEFEANSPYQNIGKILSSHGMIYEATLPRAVMGCSVEFVTQTGERCLGEVVGIDGEKCKVMPYKELVGINSQTKVYLRELTTTIKVGDGLLGRIVDFQGNPIDGKGPIEGMGESRSIFGEPINPMHRPPIRQNLDTGINAVNSFITAGKGQRLAVMAGSGVGKSTLMGMLARNTNADVNVIALIGERGREVLEFIESDLGPEGMKRSVILVATSDTSALIRMKAAYAATTIAEYFRDQNNDVIFMMDSVTRFAMANREIGMSTGEPPGQKGYGPSVFAKLPKLMERAGTKKNAGTITGIYTVLVEGDDMDEPIADAVRAIADGHIVLSRELAARNHYPAIDVLQSVSRVMSKVATREHAIVAGHLRDLMSAYKESEDLINVGAYARGTNPKVDKAITIYEDLMELLKQRVEDSYTLDDVFDRMVEIARKAETEVNPNFLEGNG
ncbi:MAG: EscN/YscN/HrcN family type III secretion system ATPase [Halobacteriovoraceae bacterium]|nr:EscN/YscN/HrcN family type III secretion system ATPase [Halobacteriovoraceae bacterium]|tara:strand:- start:5230 stop:6597 length:1368 start_codon:yes stop_codon:yes gene_type:complete